MRLNSILIILAVLAYSFGCAANRANNNSKNKTQTTFVMSPANYFNNSHFCNDSLLALFEPRLKSVLEIYSLEFSIDSQNRILLPNKYLEDESYLRSIVRKALDDNWYYPNIKGKKFNPKFENTIYEKTTACSNIEAEIIAKVKNSPYRLVRTQFSKGEDFFYDWQVNSNKFLSSLKKYNSSLHKVYGNQQISSRKLIVELNNSNNDAVSCEIFTAEDDSIILNLYKELIVGYENYFYWLPPKQIYLCDNKIVYWTLESRDCSEFNEITDALNLLAR